MKPFTINTFNVIQCLLVSNLIIYRLVSILFIVIVSMNKGYSQSPKMSIAAIAPEWNGKRVCGGYDPMPINAPTFSYSGNGIQEPSYDYSWMQKVNDGAWVAISTAKKSQFIPSFDPEAIDNSTSKSGQELVHYAWKLKVTDNGNGAQSVESDSYTLDVLSSIHATLNVVSPKSPGGKCAINLNVSGGSPAYIYDWSSLDSKISFPSSQSHVKNPAGLLPGVYQVVIKDKSCPSVKFIIDTNKSLTK